ncbi:universal stress protein [Picosynechococcus sp. PCC 7117]|uniref:universal stress protein n=1 Tax=Picosynechococcus sp. PCC 7117 TaxID=195498 RepID=UPI000810EF59|nr:universal stress protein [Picosynechococcus sp. PCC 7117]ANV88157.1 universal stress protein [Picosynechococcus sp. PCC 7117]
MQRILLCTDGSNFAQSNYQYAAWFGDRLGATINVLHVTDARSRAAADARNFSGSIGLGTSESLLQRLVALEHEKAKLDHERAKLILQEAQETLSAAGQPPAKLLHEVGYFIDCLQHLEQNTDLIILGKRGESENIAPDHLGANLERLIRSSHKPCLVTSREFQPIDRLLVAYDDSPSCRKLLDFLGECAALKALEIHVLTVTKKPGDATTNPCLTQAKQRLSTAGIEAHYHLVPGNSETAIAQFCDQAKINLLMIGAYGHSRIRHFVIGSTTAQILRSSRIPVFVYR